MNTNELSRRNFLQQTATMTIGASLGASVPVLSELSSMTQREIGVPILSGEVTDDYLHLSTYQDRQLCEITGAVNVADFGNDTKSLMEALKAIGTTETLLISQEVHITENVAIPRNVTLWFLESGYFNIARDIAMTISGPIRSGLWQIFEGEGFVELKQVDAVYPQWWGAVGDGKIDDSSAIQKAIDTGYRTVITEGVFHIGSRLMVSSLHLSGTNKHKSILRTDKSTPMFEFKGPPEQLNIEMHFKVENLTLVNTSTYAQLASVHHNIIRVHTGVNNVTIKNCVLDGGYSGVRPSSASKNWTIDQCEFRNQKTFGIMTGASYIRIQN